MKTRITILMLTILIAFVQPAFAAGGELDGKKFSGKVWGEGESGDPDTFIFKSGKFRSTACDQYGYNSAPYTVTNKEKMKIFTSTTTNKNGAKMLWQGTVEGKSIEGTAIMVDASGDKTPMHFTGSLQ